MRVVIIGSNGQLAHDLTPALREDGHEVLGLTHAQIEVADLASVRNALVAAEPELVVNTSAYHKVDEVEENPDRAFAVNAIGPRNLALVCRELDASLMHLSTDYVFSGETSRPYVETDAPAPVNLYGVSKAAGEMAIRYAWSKHLIVRTSGLYGVAGSSGKGGNFIETMLRLARDGKPIKVVNDQTLTPTWTRALARQVGALLRTEAWGTYHATCQGQCTWFEFAAAIFQCSGLHPDLSPQTTAQSGARARRPKYSVLDNLALRSLGLDVLPDWRDALEGYLKDRGLTRA